MLRAIGRMIIIVHSGDRRPSFCQVAGFRPGKRREERSQHTARVFHSSIKYPASKICSAQMLIQSRLTAFSLIVRLHLDPSSKYPASKHKTHLRRHRNELQRLPSSGAPPQHNCTVWVLHASAHQRHGRANQLPPLGASSCNRLVAALPPSQPTAFLLIRLITFQIYSLRLCK